MRTTVNAHRFNILLDLSQLPWHQAISASSTARAAVHCSSIDCSLAPRCGVVASETRSVLLFRPASASGLHRWVQFHLPARLSFLSPLPPLSRHVGPRSCSNTRSRARLCGPCLVASSRSHYSGELFNVVVAPLSFLLARTNNETLTTRNVKT